jgi:hypothetical protein
VELEEGDFLEDCAQFGNHLDEFEVNLVSNKTIVREFLKNNKKAFPNLPFYFYQMLNSYIKDLEPLNDETLDFEVEDFLI